MAFRFFKNKPGAGKPLSLRGLAEALNAMARALENIDIFGGRTDWHDGVPLLIPPEFNGYTGTGKTMPFDVRVNDDNIEAYFPALPEGTSDFASMNGYPIDVRKLIWTGDAVTKTGWQSIGAHGSASKWIVVELQKVADIDPWDPVGWLPVTAVIKQYAAASFPDGSGVNFWQRFTPIAFASYSSGAYTIVQLRRGHISFEGWGVDADALDIEPDLVTKTRSLESSLSYHGARRIRGFEAPAGNLITEGQLANIHILANETIGTAPNDVNWLKYIAWSTIADAIDAAVEGVLDGDRFPYVDDESVGDWLRDGRPHRGLGDVFNQTVNDDHRGGRTAATGIDFGDPAVEGHPYIHANGTGARNAMPGRIGDAMGEDSIGPETRNLYDSDGAQVLSWDTPGINVFPGKDYYHAGVQGVSITNWTSGGIVTGGNVVEIDAADLLPGDKILVWRPTP